MKSQPALTSKKYMNPASSQRWLISIGAVASSICGTNHGWGVGVRIANQDPAAIARGNAFVATADNPAAIYYNPAGITLSEGHNVQVGLLAYLNIYVDYESPGGARTENDPVVIPVPQIHYSYTPKNSPVSFGLGVYAPFGLSVKWPDDSPFATGGLESKLTYMTVNPVVALKVHPTLSIAAGPTLNRSELELRQSIGMVPGDQFKFKGDDVGYGFTVGLLWQPYQEWSLGATYKSGVKIDHEGTASLTPTPTFPGSFKSTTPIDFPEIITGGISFRPTTNWNFEVDVDWTDWNSVSQLAVSGVPAKRVDWVPSFQYMFGATRYLNDGYFISAGYYYSEKSTSERYFLPIVPDIDLHVGSVGVGRKGKHWRWAVAGQLIAGDWRTINNNVNPTVNGRYRLLTPTLSASCGYHF